jgi:hypothetical protein
MPGDGDLDTCEVRALDDGPQGDLSVQSVSAWRITPGVRTGSDRQFAGATDLPSKSLPVLVVKPVTDVVLVGDFSQPLYEVNGVKVAAAQVGTSEHRRNGVFGSRPMVLSWTSTHRSRSTPRPTRRREDILHEPQVLDVRAALAALPA